MMNRIDIFNKVSEVFKEVLEDDVSIKEEYSSYDVDGWDSLTHIMLVVETKKTFNVKFLSSEISNWKDIGAMTTSIESKI